METFASDFGRTLFVSLLWEIFILTISTLTWPYLFPSHSIHLNYICPTVFNLYSCFAGFLVKYKTVITI